MPVRFTFALVLLLAVPAFSTQASATTAAPPLAVSGSSMNQLQRYAPDLTTLLSRSENYAIGNPAGTQVAAPTSQAAPTLIYRSLARFRSDVANHRIDSRILAVVYDPESWLDTPLVERQYPGRAIRRFGELAHQIGYRFIAAPGRDLMLVPGASCQKRVGETLDQAYLRCGIAGTSALVSDAVVIQSQADEADPSRMLALVKAAAAQARAARAGVRVYATVSSESPCGAEVTQTTMETAFATVDAEVDGFWVNVFPSQPGDLELSAAALRSL